MRLTGRRSACFQRHAAIRQNAYDRPFEGSETGAFDIGPDTDSDITVAGASLLLALLEALIAGSFQRKPLAFGIVPAVINDRLAVAVGKPHMIRHVFDRDKIYRAHIGRVQA
ncbi:hypothetical protein MnTg02_02610 [bacterium MnTg02]|nr:hypothetical protein MnTg02_02610 [bacterium MnTg02]